MTHGSRLAGHLGLDKASATPYTDPRPMKHDYLPTVLAALTVHGFVFTMVGSDLGAAQAITLRALCAVAVLGTASFTAFLQVRGLV